jgi:hypothetical protein
MKSTLKLEDRLKRISVILQDNLALFSSWDMDAIEGKRLNQKWLDELSKLSAEDLASFDAQRNYKILQDPQWLNLQSDIHELSSFPKFEISTNIIQTLGKKKKQHELNQLHQLLINDKKKTSFDFGGGVGNLASFLEKELEMDSHVIERDEALIESGIKKLAKLSPPSKITFHKADVSSKSQIPFLKNTDLGIGLHTCGNFATDMFRVCIENKVKKIVNFGCCYSKITDDDYNLSSKSDKSLHLNSRALSCATLGFEEVPIELFQYRCNIMDYKYSLYNWLYLKFKSTDFKAMSNSRRSLYKQNFEEFSMVSLDKFFPDITKPAQGELISFYETIQNQNLLKYFKCYYALSRYFGPLIESYILCDRALFLQESGYNVEIYEVFDPVISPRNKVILAIL